MTRIKIPRIKIPNIPKIWKLRLRLLLNVFVDTLVYCMFTFALNIMSVISHYSFLEYRGESVDNILRIYILSQEVYNTLSFMQLAFVVTFLIVFVKHTSGVTADKSKKILKEIQKCDATNY